MMIPFRQPHFYYLRDFFLFVPFLAAAVLPFWLFSALFPFSVDG